jgi:hypothetical protein
VRPKLSYGGGGPAKPAASKKERRERREQRVATAAGGDTVSTKGASRTGAAHEGSTVMVAVDLRVLLKLAKASPADRKPHDKKAKRRSNEQQQLQVPTCSVRLQLRRVDLEAAADVD